MRFASGVDDDVLWDIVEECAGEQRFSRRPLQCDALFSRQCHNGANIALEVGAEVLECPLGASHQVLEFLVQR